MRASINSGPNIARSAARMERLRQAIKKANANGQGERAVSLRAELERREYELHEMKARLDAALS